MSINDFSLADRTQHYLIGMNNSNSSGKILAAHVGGACLMPILRVSEVVKNVFKALYEVFGKVAHTIVFGLPNLCLKNKFTTQCSVGGGLKALGEAGRNLVDVIPSFFNNLFNPSWCRDLVGECELKSKSENQQPTTTQGSIQSSEANEKLKKQIESDLLILNQILLNNESSSIENIQIQGIKVFCQEFFKLRQSVATHSNSSNSSDQVDENNEQKIKEMKQQLLVLNQDLETALQILTNIDLHKTKELVISIQNYNIRNICNKLIELNDLNCDKIDSNLLVLIELEKWQENYKQLNQQYNDLQSRLQDSNQASQVARTIPMSSMNTCTTSSSVESSSHLSSDEIGFTPESLIEKCNEKLNYFNKLYEGYLLQNNHIKEQYDLIQSINEFMYNDKNKELVPPVPPRDYDSSKLVVTVNAEDSKLKSDLLQVEKDIVELEFTIKSRHNQLILQHRLLRELLKQFFELESSQFVGRYDKYFDLLSQAKNYYVSHFMGENITENEILQVEGFINNFISDELVSEDTKDDALNEIAGILKSHITDSLRTKNLMSQSMSQSISDLKQSLSDLKQSFQANRSVFTSFAAVFNSHQQPQELINDDVSAFLNSIDVVEDHGLGKELLSNIPAPPAPPPMFVPPTVLQSINQQNKPSLAEQINLAIAKRREAPNMTFSQSIPKPVKEQLLKTDVIRYKNDPVVPNSIIKQLKSQISLLKTITEGTKDDIDCMLDEDDYACMGGIEAINRMSESELKELQNRLLERKAILDEKMPKRNSNVEINNNFVDPTYKQEIVNGTMENARKAQMERQKAINEYEKERKDNGEDEFDSTSDFAPDSSRTENAIENPTSLKHLQAALIWVAQGHRMEDFKYQEK